MTIFIFALLGCFIFKDINYVNYADTFSTVTDHYNFDDFYRAFVLIFISLIDAFELFLFDYMSVKSDDKLFSFLVVVYFWIYFFFCFIIMFNVFLLVIIMQYDDFYAKKENPIDKFNKISTFFRKYWSENIESDGTLMRMKSINIKHFLERFENLGYNEEFLPREELTVNSNLLFIFDINLLE